MKLPIPDAALAQHIAILGKTGSGKTSTEKLCVEQVVAEGFRVCILDSIKSDWWGITSSADGKRPGLPFRILGGPRGHIALPSSAGAAVGQLVGSGKLPLSIIDMADFEPGGLQRFFVDFAPALMRHARGVIYLVIEEAHEFAPKEKSGVGGESMATHWAKKLATAGRSKGIRLIVATQRVQALHNAVLGSCETVIAHRLTTPADQEPVLKWMKANTDKATQDKVAASLSSLPTGTGWICSGEAKIFEKIHFPKFATFDNTATPTGDGAEINVKTAPVDHDELRAIIGESVKEAEANDPRALRAEIAKLKAARPAADDSAMRAEIARLGREIVDMEKISHKRGFDEGFAQGREQFGRWVRGELKTLSDNIEGREPHVDITPAPGPVARETLPTAPRQREAIAAPMRRAREEGPLETGDLTRPQQRILRALATWAALGHTEPSREMVAAVAGYSPSSGGFNNLIGSLGPKARAIVTIPTPGRLALAAEGFAGMSKGEASDALLDVLSNPQRKIVDALNGAGAITREELGSLTEYSSSSGGFNNLIGSLNTIGISHVPMKGHVALSNWAQELLG